MNVRSWFASFPSSRSSRRWAPASLLLIAAALGGACSSDPASSASASSSASSSTGSGGAGGSGTGGGTGGGGAAPCEPGSHAVASGGCESTLASWTNGSSLMEKRDHHATFIADSDAGAFLYVLGGVQDNANELASVERAKLAADGSVGPWEAGTALPEVMAGHMIASVGATVMISGGFRTGPVLSSKTELTTVLSDGTLGPWVEGPKMKLGRFHHAMGAWKDSIYVVGGLTGNNTDSTPLVERAVVSAEGKVGMWSALTPLPERRSHHSLAIYEGALYVTAGLRGDPAGVHEDLKDVLRAPILEDGTIGDWTIAGELPVTLGTHSSVAHLGYLYVFGGVENNASNTAKVRRAAINQEGTLGAWEEVAPLPKAHAHAHQTPFHAGFVYSAGGALNHKSVADVYIGHFE